MINIKINERIFIVHGQNYYMKNEINKLLKDNKFVTILLDKKANKGKTIIEKFQHYAKKSTVEIIVMSGDDILKKWKLISTTKCNI